MKILKNLLTITYYFFLLLSAVLVIILLFCLTQFPEKLSSFIYKDFDKIINFTIAISIEMSTYILFILILYKMKLIVSDFFKEKYFTIDNAINIKFIGKMMIVMFIVDEIIGTFFTPLLRSEHKINIDFEFLEFLEIATFKLFIGLFLLGVGKAFELGLKQQQENELTI